MHNHIVEQKPVRGTALELYRLNEQKIRLIFPPDFDTETATMKIFRNGIESSVSVQPVIQRDGNTLYAILSVTALQELPGNFDIILLIDGKHVAITPVKLTLSAGHSHSHGIHLFVTLPDNIPVPIMLYANGKDGKPGREVLLDVQDNTLVWQYVGETDWRILAEIPAGKSAYDIAVENGYEGTEAEWIAMLQDRVTVEEVIKMLDSSGVLLYYGSEYEISDPDPQLWRTGIETYGNPNPIAAKMRGCLLADNGTVNYYLDPEDWSKKQDGTPSDLTGADGMVMVEIPEHYRTIEINSSGGETFHHIKISEYPLPGFRKIEQFYYAAYESAYDNVEDKLASVVNSTARYRGGDNTDNFFLGKPATGLDLPTARQAVRNRGAGWELLGINELDAVRFLYLVEYQHRDSQLKLGTGAVYNLQDQEGNNLTGPPCVCGATNSLGSGSGKVVIGSVIDGNDEQQDIEAVRYRGIENIFGNVFELLDGVMSDYTADVRAGIFVATSPAHYADYTPSEEEKWKKVTPSYPVTLSSYGTITRMAVEGGYLLPYLQQMGAASDTFWGDYIFPDASEPLTTIHPLLHGGGAGGLSADAIGLFFCMANTPYYFSMLSTEIGSRIIYRPQ